MAPLGLRDGDRERLTSLMRAGLLQRARIVLLASEGLASAEVARPVGASLPTVGLWRARYASGGLDGLADRARSGQPRRLDHRQIMAATLRPPPKRLG